MLFVLQNIDSPGVIWKIFRNKELQVEIRHKIGLRVWQNVNFMVTIGCPTGELTPLIAEKAPWGDGTSIPPLRTERARMGYPACHRTNPSSLKMPKYGREPGAPGNSVSRTHRR